MPMHKISLKFISISDDNQPKVEIGLILYTSTFCLDLQLNIAFSRVKSRGEARFLEKFCDKAINLS